MTNKALMNVISALIYMILLIIYLVLGGNDMGALFICLAWLTGFLTKN